MKKRILLCVAMASALMFSGCGGDNGNGYNNSTGNGNGEPVVSELAFYQVRDNQTGGIAGMGDTLEEFVAAFGNYNHAEPQGRELTMYNFLNGSLNVSIAEYAEGSAVMIDLQPFPADIESGRFTVQDITIGITQEELLAIDGVSGPYGWDDHEHFARVLNFELFSYTKSIFVIDGVVVRIVLAIAG
ncbi:MAG: hypothetical protein FWB98_07080 [Defluviitaleaceae bacterium]|nr:hypothetical protein [Defluviitaleaceae bacterium]